MMLTEEKCAAAEGWIEDLLFNQGNKPYDVKATVIPDIHPKQIEAVRQSTFGIMRNELMAVVVSPQEVNQAAEQLIDELKERFKQFADEQIELLKDELEDHIVESNWKPAILEFIQDFCTYPVAYLKGPYVTLDKKIKWGYGGVPTIEENLQFAFDRVSPFDIYFQPGSSRLDEGYTIERHRLTREEIYSFIGLEGFNEDALRSVLREYESGLLTDWLFDIEKYERRGIDSGDNVIGATNELKNEIQAIQFWGPVQGSKLIDWGIEEEIDDELKDYHIEAWLIGSYVIKAIINTDPLGRAPYHSSCFRKRNGSIPGIALPEILNDAQDACNAAARNMVDNMSIASGPQVGVDTNSIPPGEDVTNIYPWKVWEFEDTGGKTPLWFFQPNSMVNDLMKVYEFFSLEADNKSGIPKYSYGQGSQSGALSTATGFSMMMNNVTKGVRKLITTIDGDIIEKSIPMLYEKLLFAGMLEYKGDIKIIATGSGSILLKEQAQMRRNEFLQVINSNPIFINLIGEAGLAEILRKIAHGLDIDIERFIPDANELKAKQQMMMQIQAAQAAQMQQQGGQQQIPSREGNAAGQPASGGDVSMY